MESLFVLTHEHTGIRRLMRALNAALESDDPELQQQLFDRLRYLLLDLHAPKEDQLVMTPVFRGELQNRQVLRALNHQRARVLNELAELESPFDTTVPRLQGLLAGLSVLLDQEEDSLYPALVHMCSEDDLWNISVELDRSLDHVGRREWSRLVHAPSTSGDVARA